MRLRAWLNRITRRRRPIIDRLTDADREHVREVAKKATALLRARE